VALERLVDDAALHPLPAAMDESDIAEPGGVRFVEILLNDRGDVSRREGVQVEGAFDGDPERVLILHRYGVEAGLS